MSTGNAFWREVIDQVPHLILLFRVDEQENAHLMFTNQRIKQQLGYTAKEYVLASESDKHVEYELTELIDKVAKRSHDVERIDTDLVSLTTKFGEQRDFVYDFELFKTRAGDKRYIIVELQKGRIYPEQTTTETKQASVDEGAATQAHRLKESGWIGSPLLDRVVDRLLQMIEQSQPVLVQGEHGVGKSRLIEHAVQESGASLNQVVVDGDELSSFLNAEPTAAPADLVIVENIEKSETPAQEALVKRWRNQYDPHGTVLIMTITKSVDDLINDGKLIPALYYEMNSAPLIIPPVRHRSQEIVKFAEQFIRQAASVINLKLGDPIFTDSTIDALENRSWEGNVTELLEVLRSSLLKAEPGQPLDLYIREERQSSLFPEEHINEEDVLNFDEMNRRYLERILEITGGKIYGDDGAAALLELKPTTLQSKLKRLGVK
jgi:transcriptional regulator of acetoin/glycerol metabolism